MTETVFHVTRAGWKIDANCTPKRQICRLVEKFGYNEAIAAKHLRMSVAELRRRKDDDRLPPEPVLSPEVNAILAKPMPVVEYPSPGGGTEEDLIRLCALAAELLKDYRALDAVAGGSLYSPPKAFEARADELRDLRFATEEAAAAIPALTARGRMAKYALLASEDLEDCLKDITYPPIAASILRDCAATVA